jgi:hypothetical protein
MTAIWELDFYSRPILDEEGKKVWEVVITESAQRVDRDLQSLYRYSQFCPSTQVNSLWLQESVQAAIEQAPQPPSQIRFFRRQMSNMITKTCKDLGIACTISRRTITLHYWLQQRYAEVYPQEPGYQADAQNPSVQYAVDLPQPLPDQLQGDRWTVVTLPAEDFAEMPEWDIGFSEGFPLSLTGLSPATPIPGLIIYSGRALPLAAWMSGIELGCLKLDLEPAATLVLETGASDRWVLANLPNEKRVAEIKSFEAAKAKANQVHFLAVQSDPNAEAFAGFWLLQDLEI